MLLAVFEEDVGNLQPGHLLDIDDQCRETSYRTGSRAIGQPCSYLLRADLPGPQEAPSVSARPVCRGNRARCGELRAVSRRRTSPARQSASTSATIASATTPAAGTAHTSLRWLIAFAASPVATSIVSSARGTVEMGFIAARTRRTSPVDIPPSVPPARLVRRRTPPSPLSISSCANDPRRRADSKPSPTSTPLMAWMPINAPARRESSRRSQWT